MALAFPVQQPQANVHFLLVEILTIKESHNGENAVVYEVKLLKYFSTSFSYGRFYQFLPFALSCNKVMHTHTARVLETVSCVKGNSRLLFH